LGLLLSSPVGTRAEFVSADTELKIGIRGFEKLGQLVESVPCYWLEINSDPAVDTVSGRGDSRGGSRFVNLSTRTRL
jgi:hypothetical protein